MTRFCLPCRIWVAQHEKAARRAAFFFALILGLSLLGWFSQPVSPPGMCLVYP